MKHCKVTRPGRMLTIVLVCIASQFSATQARADLDDILDDIDTGIRALWIIDWFLSTNPQAQISPDGSAITAEVGDFITGAMVLPADSVGISSIGVGFQFDSSELDLVSIDMQFLPPQFDSFSSALNGNQLFLEASASALGPVDLAFAMAVVKFQVLDPQADGDDIIGSFGDGGIFDNGGLDITNTYSMSTAQVNPIPGPGAAALLALSGLLAVRRRR